MPAKTDPTLRDLEVRLSALAVQLDDLRAMLMRAGLGRPLAPVEGDFGPVCPLVAGVEVEIIPHLYITPPGNPYLSTAAACLPNTLP